MANFVPIGNAPGVNIDVFNKNLYDPTPDASKYDVLGQLTGSYAINTTKALINASTANGLLIGSIGAFGTDGKGRLIKNLCVSSTQRVTIRITLGASIIGDYNLEAYQPFYIPNNWILKLSGAAITAYVRKCWSAADTDIAEVTFSAPDSYLVMDDFREGKICKFKGDSISNLVGVSKMDCYHWLFVDKLRSLGKKVRSDIYGENNSTTETHKTKFRNGDYENKWSNNAMFGINLGTNDASSTTGVALATYKANMKYNALRMLSQPEAKVPVIMFGAPPCLTSISGNPARATNIDLQAIALTEIVAEINDPYLFAIDLSTSFSKTDAAMFSSDGAGLHPNAVGHGAIFNNTLSPWLSTPAGIRFLSLLLK